MNRDEIIRMAREAGAKPGIENVADEAFLERFYALAVAKEREARQQAQREAEALRERIVKSGLELHRAVRDAVKEEREACAKVCDARYMGDNNREDAEARRCADAIRARGAQ